VNPDEAQEIAVKATGLTKSFGETKAVVGIDLEVKRGTVTALLGPNGAGKTTMVRLLTTLLKPDGGTALVGGVDVAADANAVRRKIGLTGQDTAVDELLTGRENLVMIARLSRLNQQQAVQRADELLSSFDLQDAADRSTGTYSGGMRRRLDLAASLIADPEILFLDEPTTGLDPRSRISMWEKIEELVEHGTTVLLTTQYLEEADQLADEIVVIDHGAVIARGTADELKDDVGGQRLEFKLGSADALDRAVEKFGAQGVEVVGREDREHRVTVALTAGAVQVARLIDSLESDGVKIEEVFVHRPTLDDVFLSLTGEHVAKDEEAEA
jgi:ABC-2 type transport system ATP-binding protein